MTFPQEVSKAIEKKIEFIYELSNINLNEAIIETKKLVDQIEHYSFYDQTLLYGLTADLQITNGDFDKAIEACEKGFTIAEAHNLVDASIRLKYLLAKAYTEKYEYEKALETYTDLLDTMDGSSSVHISNLIKINFATLNHRIGNYRKALDLLLEVYKNEYFVLTENPILHQNLVLDIADLYNEIGKVDSTFFYIERFHELLQQTSDDSMITYLLKVEGNIAYGSRKYNEAIKKYNSYLSKVLEYYQYFDIEIALKKSHSFFQLQQYDSVLVNLDLIAENQDFSKKLSRKSLSEFYGLYVDTYNEKGNKTLSSDYYTKYVNAREDYNNSRFKTLSGLYEINTKEILAEGEQTEKKYKTYITYISIVLGLLIVLGIGFYVFKTNKDKKRFAQLIATVDAYEAKQKNKEVPEKGSIVENLPRNIEREQRNIAEEPIVKQESVEESVKDKAVSGFGELVESSPIKDEKVQELLKKLENLKESGYFLRQDSSLYNTAKKLKTNTSYLSSVINNTMGTNFNRFVNDIRMDYIILELKNNKRMRSYSVKGISEEIGYKSADSFTKYFRESTGLSPSAFIRNLNKEFKI
jgi:AraC-like DNA-binding protein